MIALEAKDLYCRFPGMEEYILNGISLSLSEGEILALTGASGVGKSTLCYCLLGLIPRIVKGRVQGEIYVCGQPLAEISRADYARAVGIVMQNPDDQLFSPSIEGEIAFGPENLCLPREEIGRRIAAALAMVGMEEYRYASPMHLSGGQKQLIALAAVLALEPKIFVFDEALSQLDPETKEKIKAIIVMLKEKGHAILMVEHDFANMEIASRILTVRSGRIMEEKRP